MKEPWEYDSPESELVALRAELLRLRDAIAWRCRDCGCAFPDFPTHKKALLEGAERCSGCVELEALRQALAGRPCAQCRGEGVIDVPDKYVVQHQADCPACGGSGREGGAP